MKFAIVDGWTIETNDSVLIEVLTAIEHVKAVIKAYDELPYEDVLKTTGYDWRELSDLMDASWYDDRYKPYHDLIDRYYWLEDATQSEAYRRAYEADFLAFERKNVDYAKGLWIGSEDDYNMYSDWSKDMYGHRIRWRVASRI